MLKFQIMDRSGHSTVEFDAGNTVSLADAEKRFKELTGSGLTAATRRADGTATVTRSFDPTAAETLFIPQLQGG